MGGCAMKYKLSLMQDKMLEACSDESEAEKARGSRYEGRLRTTSIDFSKLNIDSLRRFQVRGGEIGGVQNRGIIRD